MSVVIQTDHLTKSYGRSRGVEDVNLCVQQGEVFGFLGPNGAGKTTTIRTILNFLRPTSGSATVLGYDSQRDNVAIRASVGNLPGEFTLDDRLTGNQLIRFFARLRGVTDLRYAYHLAERLDAQLERPMRRLSRGNKQKIGLIQAMFHRPPLLVLDEPTGGLDPLVQEEFLHIIAETKAEGRTLFFSSHVLSEVERICDRVGIIRSGRLVAVETTSSLIDKQFRRMALTFAAPVDAAPFRALPSVGDVKVDGTTLRFTLHDNLDQVVKLAAQHTLLDMQLERPSLEEIFLTYYDQEDGG